MKQIGITAFVLMLFTLTVGAQQRPEIKLEAKPGARWWWLGSAVDKENLRWTMEEYAHHGIGALEITPIYGVQGNDKTTYHFFLTNGWPCCAKYRPTVKN